MIEPQSTISQQLKSRTLLRTISMTTTTTMTSTTLRLGLKVVNYHARSLGALFSLFAFWQNFTRVGAGSSPPQAGGNGPIRCTHWHAVTRLGWRLGAGRGPGSLKQHYHYHPGTL
jgi:hypothetical protein